MPDEEPSGSDPPEDGDRGSDDTDSDPEDLGGAAADGTPDPDDQATDAATAAGDGEAGDGPVGSVTDAFAAAGYSGSHWLRDYVRDHTIHTVVIALFAAYPFVYAGVTSDLLVATVPFYPAWVPDLMTTLLPGINLMVMVLIFGLFAMSFDFVSGYTGYLSFGHAAFYGIGAYAVVMAANEQLTFLIPDAVPAVGGTVLFHLSSNTPFVFMLVVAGLMAVVVALFIGAVSFRLSGVYFAMITLGFSQVIFVFFQNWNYVGGREGTRVSFETHQEGFRIGVPFVDQFSMKIGRLTGSKVVDFFGVINLSTTEVSYLMIGLVVVLCYFAMQRVVHSPFGRVMIAIRENEERARAVGYNTYAYEMGTFAISAFFAAVAGGLFVGYTRSVSPEETLFFLVAGDALLAAIIGGFGTLAGALFGWLLYQSLQQFLTANVVSGTPDGILPYLQQYLGEDVIDWILIQDFTLSLEPLFTLEVPNVSIRALFEVLLSGRASLYIGIMFVLFVLYVPNGILGTIRLRLGGTLAKAVPDRLFGPREAGGDAPAESGAD